jgi:hypothetical protein
MSQSSSAQRRLTQLHWLSLFVLAAVVLWPYRHSTGDDAYISFRFVQNLARGDGFSFNPDEPTYGSTAPAWVFLLTALHSVGLTIETAAHVLGYTSIAVCIATFGALVARYVESRPLRWVAVALFIVDPWFVRWSLSGMENPLALALVLVAMLAQLHLRNSGRVNWISPAAGAFAVLARPEMTLFTGLIFLDTLLFERKRRVAQVLVGGALGLLVISPWLWYAQQHFGTIVPNTISAKLSRLHVDALVGTLKYFATFWPLQAAAVGLVALTSRKWLQDAQTAEFRERWFLPVAWALCLPAFYVVGGAPVAGRYMMYGLPAYLLIGVSAWGMLLAPEGFPAWFSLQRRRALVVASLVLTALLVSFVQYKYLWHITRWPQGMDPKMIEIAAYLRENSREDEVVAADQVGVLGYFSERYVIDLMGLVSPEMLPVRKSKEPHAIWKYIRDRKADYLFVIDDLPLLTSRDPRYASLELLKVEEIQREGAAAAGKPVKYYLYRTHWREDQTPPPREFKGAASSTQ